MKAFGVTILVIILIGFITTGGIAMSSVASLNREALLRASINAQERGREASFDTMKKIIMQKTQLPAAARADLLVLLPELISGRQGGAVFKSVQEQYPELTLSLYQDISRSIEAERHVFLRKQESLFDVKREHDALLDSAFGGTICRLFGRSKVEVVVISSTEAKNVIETGVDNDSNLGL